MQAQQIVLKNQMDEEKSLKSYLNEKETAWLLLYFYPKDDTPGCTKQACDFSSQSEEFAKLGVRVVGVSPDDVTSHQKFIEKQSLKIDLLSDPEKKLIKAFGAWGIKKNYGKEYEGLIRSTFLLDSSGSIVQEWKNVRATGHVARVLKEVTKTLSH